jgi:hypothetical protein
MHYGSTTEATDFVPHDRKARLVRVALSFVPRANPDFEPLFPQVRKWLEQLWSRARAEAPNNALKGPRAKRARP